MITDWIQAGSTIVLVLVTIFYAVDTNRIAQVSKKQIESSDEQLKVMREHVEATNRYAQEAKAQVEQQREQLEVSRETLAFYREQSEKEAQPLLFASAESISGKKGALSFDDRQVAIYNFSKNPVFVRYASYEFTEEENRKMYLGSDQFHAVTNIGRQVLRPYDSLGIPYIKRPFFGNDKPVLHLYFVYGSLDYKFSIHVPDAGSLTEQEIMRHRIPF